MRIGLVATLGAAALASVPVLAADVNFSANVSNSCTLMVLQHGTMRANASNRIISSRFAGETPGLVRVINSGFARVTAPGYENIAWNAPPSDTTWTQKIAYVSGTAVGPGGTNAPQRTGDSGFNLSHSGGITDVTVHLEARKNGGNRFEAATYSGTVTVLCE